MAQKAAAAQAGAATASGEMRCSAARVLRVAGQELEHARLMRTKNTFVDIALPADDDSSDESSPSQPARRSRSCDAVAACLSAPLVGGAPPPSGPQPAAAPRGRAATELPAATPCRLPEGFVTVVRNTFVEVKDVEAEAEKGGQLRRSASQGPPASRLPPPPGAEPAGAERADCRKPWEEGASSTCSTSDDRAAESLQPDAGAVLSQGAAFCMETPVKAGFQGARSRSPGSAPLRAGRGSAEEWSPALAPKAPRPWIGSALAADDSASSERLRVQLDLEKILWGRLPGACLQASGGESSSEDSSSDSDCELTRRRVSAELKERIRRCRQRAGARRPEAHF